MSGKGTQYILRKVSVIEKFASLVWFPIKYTVSFIFKKSLFKTLSKLFSEKMKDCKVCYQNLKSAVLCVTRTFSGKILPSKTFLLFYSWKSLSIKVWEFSLSLCEQFLVKATDMLSIANIERSFEPLRQITSFHFETFVCSLVC